MFRPSPYWPLKMLIELLPEDKKWTADQRRRWLNAVEASVDWLVEEIKPITTTGAESRKGTEE